MSFRIRFEKSSIKRLPRRIDIELEISFGHFNPFRFTMVLSLLRIKKCERNSWSNSDASRKINGLIIDFQLIVVILALILALALFLHRNNNLRFYELLLNTHSLFFDDCFLFNDKGRYNLWRGKKKYFESSVYYRTYY